VQPLGTAKVGTAEGGGAPGAGAAEVLAQFGRRQVRLALYRRNE
jgi:hypothetical protein